MIYGLFAWIDWVIYKIAATLFRVIFGIAETDFFTKTQIADVAKRVYLILGVLILFEVVISAVQFLVNPDKFEDKDKGFFGLLQKTVITIVLIVIVPVVFDFALSIQGAVIKAIPSIIFGTEASQNIDKEHIGEELSFTVLSSFVQARQGKNGSIGSDPKNEIHDIDTFTAHVADGCPFFLVTIIGGNCEYNYLVLASSLAGGFLIYILMSMALDVAVRTIKLGIIQILSPIPISSYIFGKDKFNKFVKMSLQVYADLFIRMAIVYLIIFTFKSLLENGILNVAAINGGVADTNSWLMNVIVNIMIIFGLLMFAKSAPKFLSDLLGLPEISGGDMADMFKPAWQRVGGFSGLGAGVGAYRNAMEWGENPRRAWRRALSAGAHATVARLRDVASGKSLDESYKSSKEAAMKRTNRNLEYRNRYGDNWRRQLWQERWDAYTGVTSGAKRTAAEITAAQKAMEIKSKAWSRANEKSIEKRGATWMNGAAFVDRATGQNITLSEALTLENDFAASPTATSLTINGKTFDKQWLADNMQAIKDHASRAFIANAFSHIENNYAGGDGETINTFRNKMLEIMRSGADGATLDTLCTQTVTARNPDGSAMLDAHGNEITRTYDLRTIYDAVRRGDNLSSEMSWAMADIIQNINRTAGNVEAAALERKTSDPPSS